MPNATADKDEKWKKYTDLFEKEVHNRAVEVDPYNDQDWYSITLGWAIGKGIEPEEANEFATYIRYSTNLG